MRLVLLVVLCSTLIAAIDDVKSTEKPTEKPEENPVEEADNKPETEKVSIFPFIYHSEYCFDVFEL